VWIHLRQRSHWLRFGSPESPSPRRHTKHGGWSSSGVKGLSVENRGSIVIRVMSVPLFWCACAMWKGHVARFHSTMYSAVLLGCMLCL